MKVRDDPPAANAHGFVGRPRPTMRQHGNLEGLRERIVEWVRRMGADRSLPWAGLGIVRDLEAVMQLLDLREFAEWLRVNGPVEHRGFADDILADQFTLEAVGDALKHAGHDVPDPVAGVEALESEARAVDAVRQVLIDTGALASDDFETNVPDLVRALLS